MSISQGETKVRKFAYYITGEEEEEEEEDEEESRCAFCFRK
jgi:hypothetical protein